MKQDNFPIDEVDAQTLYMVIRELHERRNYGVLYAAKKQLEEILEGEKWPSKDRTMGDIRASLKF